MNIRFMGTLAAVAAAVTLSAPAGSTQMAVTDRQPDGVYVARLSPLNTAVTEQAARGEA